MNTYTFVGGYILSVLVIFLMLYAITRISKKRKSNQKIEKRRLLILHEIKQWACNRYNGAYEEELKHAQTAWQQWAEKRKELALALSVEPEPAEHTRILAELTLHDQACFGFCSIEKSVPFRQLGKENHWTLAENDWTMAVE